MNHTKQQLKTDATKPNRRAAHDVLKSEPAVQDQTGSEEVKSGADSTKGTLSRGPRPHRLPTQTVRMDWKKLEAAHSKIDKLRQRVETAVAIACRADLGTSTPHDRKQYIEETINELQRVMTVVQLENEKRIVTGCEQVERALRDAAFALKPKSMNQKIGLRTPCA